MNDQILLNLPESFDLTQNKDILSRKYKYNRINRKKQFVTFFDTFDWRVYNAGLVLFSIGKRIYLRLIDTNLILANSGYQKRPVFIWDFAHNDLKKQLDPILDVRALLIKGSATFLEEEGFIINEDFKKVCQILIRKIIFPNTSKSPGLYNTLTLSPLRGYQSDTRAIMSKLINITLNDSAHDPFTFIMASNNLKPGGYSSKINIKLKRNMPAQDGIKFVMKIFIKLMQQNEEGIIKDIDTEFLHDFRVAVRRTRAALSQLHIVFPPDIVKKYKKDFSFIGKQSNMLRDLDVYLLNEDVYKKMIPVRLKKSISILFDQLRNERKTAHQQFVNIVNSTQYKNIIIEWQKYLDSDIIENSENPVEAKSPIISIIKPIIQNQLDIVMNLGSEIDDHTDDKKVHALRIECKKLRYLMEFFSSLFPKNKIEKFVDHLKILQDNLGKFNDYSVQQEFLQKYLKQLSITDLQSKQTITALGALIGILYDKQTQTRQEFAIRYAQFASAENIALAMKLFKN